MAENGLIDRITGARVLVFENMRGVTHTPLCTPTQCEGVHKLAWSS